MTVPLNKAAPVNAPVSIRLFTVLVLLTHVLLCGCKRSQSGADREPQVASTRGWKVGSSNDLATIIQVGLSRREILDRLGPPDDIVELVGGGFSIEYFIRAEQIRSSILVREEIFGFSVYIKDDKVIRWSPMYGSPVIRKPDKVRSLPTTDLGSKKLSFWLVHEKPVDGGRQVDTNIIPTAAYIGTQPLLSVERLKAVSETDRWTEIELNESDAPALDELTAQNRGRRLLIMLGNTSLAAPLITSPSREGRVQILWPTGVSNSGRDTLRDMLNK